MAIWFRPEQPEGRPRLSRERIVAAAVALLDAEGVAGFSMRALAARLGCGTMSIYGYVAAKEDVLDLALDAALSEIDLDDAAGADWRATLTRLMSQSRQVMRRHPWIPALLGTRPLLGPDALARSERVYAVLHGAGLAGPGLLGAVSALSSYVNGFVLTELAWRSRHRDAAAEAELRRAAEEHIARSADRYPVLTRHAQLDNADFEDGFLLGLDVVLDGIAARLT
ncbi:TetR/AcrR family transcriptional regulator [Actinomadura craniellae]|uniref:TetR/AcrR family transcriptional regulator n=1 Tax=Actinomadura craniellae TaxID=2231787 RepID=A0A365H157_9ACTN|nr:TetR/AcrR family transcriptional regulator [Actinomadura craniellae]RAY12822.1 TetR/AcrR family transcriptional regulator [Actinomadura craniellae]